eukprot:6309101-Heterocapsa_arctica.AAC.1
MSLRIRSRCACARMHLSVGLARARGRGGLLARGRSAHARGADLRRPARPTPARGPAPGSEERCADQPGRAWRSPPGAAGGTV